MLKKFFSFVINFMDVYVFGTVAEISFSSRRVGYTYFSRCWLQLRNELLPQLSLLKRQSSEQYFVCLHLVSCFSLCHFSDLSFIINLLCFFSGEPSGIDLLSWCCLILASANLFKLNMHSVHFRFFQRPRYPLGSYHVFICYFCLYNSFFHHRCR